LIEALKTGFDTIDLETGNRTIIHLEPRLGDLLNDGEPDRRGRHRCGSTGGRVPIIFAGGKRASLGTTRPRSRGGALALDTS
jgi:hypothetical protein